MHNDFYVYALFDPKDDTPFYIGKGRGHRDRWHLHKSTVKNSKFFVHNKIRKMRREGREPLRHRLLDHLDEAAAHLFESFFIKALGRRGIRSNPGPLCNCTDGGEGISNPSRATRRKMSRGIKAALSDKSVRSRIGAGSRANWNRPEFRGAVVSAIKERWADADFHALASKAILEAATMPGRLAKPSRAQYRLWANTDHKRKMSESRRAAWANPRIRHKRRVSNHTRKPLKGAFKGVSFDKRRNKFSSSIAVDGVRYRLGRHSDAAVAARVFDAVARVLSEGQCYVNFAMLPEWWED